MAGSASNRRGLTLTELAVVIVSLAVIALIAWTAWAMSWREVHAARVRTRAYRNAYATVERIREEVMRAKTIEIPDPEFPYLDSIQLHVDIAGVSVRRAFRLVDDELVIDLKDEGVAPFMPFDHISTLEFTMVDPPTNSIVEIVCAADADGQDISVSTSAWRRN